MHCVLEVAVFDDEVHGPVGLGLAGLAEHFEGVAAGGVEEVQVLDFVGAIDAVEGESAGGREVDLLALAQVLHLGFEREGEAGQVGRGLQLIHAFAVFVELEVAHFLRGAHALAVDRCDDEGHVLEHGEGDGRAVELECGADHHVGLLAVEQGLAVHVDARGEGVALGLVAEGIERREAVVHEDHLLRGGAVSEGHGDLALVVGRVKVAGEPQGGLGQLAVLLVEHGEHGAGRAGAGEEAQLALADEGATAHAIPDELHNIGTTLGQGGEVEVALHAAQRRHVVGVGLLLIGHQAVELDARVHLAALLAVVVQRVDLEDLHD